jgi:hypothetical protein
MGPGYYHPEKTGSIIGGSEMEKSRRNMYSTVTKASFNATVLDSSSSAMLQKEKRFLSNTVLDKSIFGSSSARFQSQNQNDEKQRHLPGPGNYYGFGAGNFNPGQKDTNNVPINDSRALDD